MALLNMLPPKGFTLEKLGTLGHLASELGLILLLYILFQLFIQTFIQRFATKLLHIDVLWFQDLQNLFLKRVEPIKLA